MWGNRRATDAGESKLRKWEKMGTGAKQKGVFFLLPFSKTHKMIILFNCFPFSLCPGSLIYINLWKAIGTKKEKVCLSSMAISMEKLEMLLQPHEKSNSTSTKWSHRSPEQCGQAPGPLHVPDINTHHTLALGHPCRRYYKVYDLFLYGKVQEC